MLQYVTLAVVAYATCAIRSQRCRTVAKLLPRARDIRSTLMQRESCRAAVLDFERDPYRAFELDSEYMIPIWNELERALALRLRHELLTRCRNREWELGSIARVEHVLADVL